MNTTPNIGDVKVKSKTTQSLFAGGNPEAFIWTTAGWKPLTAKISVRDQQRDVTVRVLSGDLAGLPHPTGTTIVEDPIAGWTGVTTIQ